jgi:hypothetical protein
MIPHVTFTTALQLASSALLLGAFGVVVLVREAIWPMPPIAPRGYLDRADFEQQTRLLDADNEAACAAFFARALDVYTQRNDSMKRLEDKAATILSFVGGGSGLIAIAAGSDKVVHLVPTPLLLLACAFLFGVLTSAIFVQRPVRRAVFDARRLSAIPLLRATGATARINAISGWEYLEAARNTAGNVKLKAKWLTYAQVCFALGIAAIVLNVLISSGEPSSPAPPPSPTTVHCTPAGAALDCTITTSKGRTT